MLCYAMYVERERVHLFARNFIRWIPKGKWAWNPWVFSISDPVLGQPDAYAIFGRWPHRHSSVFAIPLSVGEELQVAYIVPMLTHFNPRKAQWNILDLSLRGYGFPGQPMRKQKVTVIKSELTLNYRNTSKMVGWFIPYHGWFDKIIPS